MPKVQLTERESIAAIDPVAVTRPSWIALFFFGSLLATLGLTIYYVGILLSIVRLVFHLGEPFRAWTATILWWSGLPSTQGIILAAADLALMLPAKRRRSRADVLPPVFDRQVVVALTAYNDQQSIAAAVTDFRNHPLVSSVIVV